jgi:hypothetical protein
MIANQELWNRMRLSFTRSNMTKDTTNEEANYQLVFEAFREF